MWYNYRVLEKELFYVQNTLQTLFSVKNNSTAKVVFWKDGVIKLYTLGEYLLKSYLANSI